MQKNEKWGTHKMYRFVRLPSAAGIVPVSRLPESCLRAGRSGGGGSSLGRAKHAGSTHQQHGRAPWDPLPPPGRVHAQHIKGTRNGATWSNGCAFAQRDQKRSRAVRGCARHEHAQVRSCNYAFARMLTRTCACVLAHFRKLDGDRKH